MRVAILSSGNPSDMKGIMNYVQEKAMRMQQLSDIGVIVDVYLIRIEMSRLFMFVSTGFKFKSLLKKQETHSEKVIIGNIEYNNIWIRYGLWDNIWCSKIRKQYLGNKDLKKIESRLGFYDIIASHKVISHVAALYIKKRRQIPFVATWHGSDINVDPFKECVTMLAVKDVLANADMNLFVSQALLDTSNKIQAIGHKNVLYTGPSDFFVRSSDDEIISFKKDHSITDEIIIGFVGNLLPIKNVLILPQIMALFNKKERNYNHVIWIAGNGPLEESLRNEFQKAGIKSHFFGKLDPTQVPLFTSSLDILILPSLNEGLPLVVLEAKKCGVNVVGSNVGGIKEAIGAENCFDLDKSFVERISDRMAEMVMTNEKPQPLDEKFSWETAIKKECEIYKMILL